MLKYFNGHFVLKTCQITNLNFRAKNTQSTIAKLWKIWMFAQNSQRFLLKISENEIENFSIFKFLTAKIQKFRIILMDIKIFLCSKLAKEVIWILALKLLNRQKAKSMKYLKVCAKIKDFDSKWAKTKVKILEFFGKFWSWF